MAPVMRIEELTMTLLNNDNCLSVQRWAGASTIEKMKFVSSNMLEPTENIASLVAYLVKDATCHAGDEHSIPGLGRSPGKGNGNPLQYSCLENSMDRGAWQATVHGVTKNQTRLSTHTHTHPRTQANMSKSQTFTHGILATLMLA